jgi:hypothetical protein
VFTLYIAILTVNYSSVDAKTPAQDDRYPSRGKMSEGIIVNATQERLSLLSLHLF